MLHPPRLLTFAVMMQRLALLALLLVLVATPVEAQRIAKYGADFLAGGVGARALGMGGAHVALASDVTAGYWNPAGLSATVFPQAAYMHAERFDGIVQFDYGAVAFPLSVVSTLGVSFFRSGIDDIPNTLQAWENGQPRSENVTFFSAADYAFFISYARQVRDHLSAGASVKVIRRTIGDFASAWGYSLDLGAQLQLGTFAFGANIQDLTGMLQSWSVNGAAFEGLEAFGQELPEGGSEIVLPVARLGAGLAAFPLTRDIGISAGLDVDVAFDGQRAYAFNAGDVSFHPRLGTELSYREVVALRLGISDVTSSARFGTQVTPTVGVGLNLGPLAVDYGFGDFGGIRQELGYSHRISLQYTLRQERFARPDR
jgi:hypothetical protein